MSSLRSVTSPKFQEFPEWYISTVVKVDISSASAMLYTNETRALVGFLVVDDLIVVSKQRSK